MKTCLLTLLVLGLTAAQKSESNADDLWSWVTAPGKQEEKTETKKDQRLDTAESIDEVVDSILLNGRQGRNLDGYDEIFRDPNVQSAIQNGNDSTARHYIKERLCNLGLMQCEDDAIPKRGSVHPSDVIYAQPVAVKPVGHPIPAVPVRGPHHIKPDVIVGPYGPPRPVPFSGKYGPPPGPHYKPYRPHGPKPYPVYEKPSFEEVSGPGIIEHELPPFIEGGHVKGSADKSTVVVNTQGGSGVQQHVHHHYHHGSGSVPSGPGVSISQKPLVVERPVIVEKPVPVPTPIHHGSIHGGSIHGGSIHSGSIHSGSIHSHQPAPVYESSDTTGFSGSYNGIYGGHHGTYGSGSGGSYLGQDSFYKKQLNVNGGSSSASYANGFSSYHTPRADELDKCFCVPASQCPSYDVIGRKDEGNGIDPRSNVNGVNIEAIGLDDVVITDGNGTIISHHAAKTTAKRESESEESSTEKVEESTKERRKRDADERTGNGDNKSEIKPRLLNGGIHEELSKLKVSPTFGVSFGLPQSGDYPINPLTGHPVINPYGHTINGNGVKIGPVNVNPLLAVQVTKDDLGEKVVKPLVNLHVTPTHGFIHKIGGIKHKLLSHISHDHHHHHVHTYSKPYKHHYYKPYETSYPHHPTYDKPSYGFSPSYASQYDSYDGYDYGYSNNGHYSDYDDSYSDGYDRSAKSLNITARPRPTDIEADNSYDYDYPLTSSASSSSPYHQSSTSNQPSSDHVSFPRNKRDVSGNSFVKRQAYYGGSARCGPGYVCCRRPPRPIYNNRGHCGRRNAQGINGRIKTPSYVDGESEFGEYPWQVAILKKDPQESVYVCGGTLIDNLHIITAAHCVKSYSHYDLRVRLGEWDVNHDVEFYPYIERDVSLLQLHPEFYAGTLQNDIAILRMDKPVDLINNPHISAACLPEPHSEYAGARCWTTGWGKDAFGDYGKYQNILKEVDVPVISHHQCQALLQQTRLGYDFKLHPGFVCAGGEEGKDACKGDGGGPMVCERGGTWQVVGIVSWGVGCGQGGVPGVYVKVSHYLDWIRQITNRY